MRLFHRREAILELSSMAVDARASAKEETLRIRRFWRGWLLHPQLSLKQLDYLRSWTSSLQSSNFAWR